MTPLVITGAGLALPTTVGMAVGLCALAGAAAHVASPVVLGLMGKTDPDPKGFCALAARGLFDGIAAPVMATGYAAAFPGRWLGAMAGGIIGGTYGAGCMAAKAVHERLLRPVLECRPVKTGLSAAGQGINHAATRFTCPSPDFGTNANALGQRLRNRFASLSRKEAAPGTQNPRPPADSSSPTHRPD